VKATGLFLILAGSLYPFNHQPLDPGAFVIARSLILGKAAGIYGKQGGIGWPH
jgi:hypothetical protein